MSNEQPTVSHSEAGPVTELLKHRRQRHHRHLPAPAPATSAELPPLPLVPTPAPEFVYPQVVIKEVIEVVEPPQRAHDFETTTSIRDRVAIMIYTDNMKKIYGSLGSDMAKHEAKKAVQYANYLMYELYKDPQPHAEQLPTPAPQ